jgi:hypothetical protein
MELSPIFDHWREKKKEKKKHITLRMKDGK